MPVKLLTDFNAFVSAYAAGGFVGWGIVYLSRASSAGAKNATRRALFCSGLRRNVA
jgi:hypothetical protein